MKDTNKFYKGQLVILARPEITLNMKGTIGEVVALPGEQHERIPSRIRDTRRYLVYYPGFTSRFEGFWESAERMLDPLIQGEDNRTAEDESRLIFNPKKKLTIPIVVQIRRESK